MLRILSLHYLQVGVVSENVLWQVSQLVVTQVPDKNLCEIREYGLIQTNSKLRINILLQLVLKSSETVSELGDCIIKYFFPPRSING